MIENDANLALKINSEMTAKDSVLKLLENFEDSDPLLLKVAAFIKLNFKKRSNNKIKIN